MDVLFTGSWTFWVAFIWGHLWIKPLQIPGCMFLCEYVFLFLISKYLVLELLSQKVSIFLIYKKLSTIFQSGCTIFYSHQNSVRIPLDFHLHQYLILSIFFLSHSGNSIRCALQTDFWRLCFKENYKKAKSYQ